MHSKRVSRNFKHYSKVSPSFDITFKSCKENFDRGVFSKAIQWVQLRYIHRVLVENCYKTNFPYHTTKQILFRKGTFD